MACLASLPPPARQWDLTVRVSSSRGTAQRGRFRPIQAPGHARAALGACHVPRRPHARQWATTPMGSNCLRDEGLLIEPIIFKPGQPVYSRIGVIDRMGLRDCEAFNTAPA